MAQGYDAFGSPIGEERPFTTAWGEYDPHQSSAWGSEGYTPDWAQPYKFNEGSSRRQYGQHTRTPSSAKSSIENFWRNWHGVEKPSRAIAITLAVLFGTLGAHRFYYGDKVTGAIMAAMTLISFGSFAWITAIWGFVDAYKYYHMSDIEFANYCYGQRQVTT